MKIAFMGSDRIALPMLDFIISDECPGMEVALVFTQPDRRTGRGMHLQVNEIKAWAQQNSIRVEQPLKCGPEQAAILEDLNIDLVLVMAYGQILPRCILEATPNKVLNIHASLLPRLRGASPIHTAIALGLEETGVSLMEIVPKLDAGPVAEQEQIRIDRSATTQNVIEDLASATVSLIKRSLEKLSAGELDFRKQDSEKVTYCRIIDKTDRFLDFNQSAEQLHNRIRAFQPWPGTTFLYHDAEIRILKSDVVFENETRFPAGTVLTEHQDMLIVCGRGMLKPLILQRPGGKPLATGDFIRGYPIDDKSVVASREMHHLEQRTPFPYKKR